MEAKAVLPETVTIKLPRGALAGWHVLIETLERARERTGANMVFDDLIQQIEGQTASEPTGHMAVVEDFDGKRWVRYDRDQRPWYQVEDERWCGWAELHVIQVHWEGIPRDE